MVLRDRQVELLSGDFLVDSHDVHGRGLEVAGLVQSVGHVDSLVVLLAVNLLVFQVKSVLDWSDEVEGDFEVFVEVLLFLDGRNDHHEKSLLANSVALTDHHDVDVV